MYFAGMFLSPNDLKPLQRNVHSVKKSLFFILGILGKVRKFWSNMEVWGIMSTLILQDGPFLATRLYVMIGKNAVHQMIIFFTCKNLLIVILQLYRLIVIAVSMKDAEEEEDDPFLKNIETIKALALAKNKFSQGLKKNNDSSKKNLFEKQPAKIAPATNGKELPQV